MKPSSQYRILSIKRLYSLTYTQLYIQRVLLSILRSYLDFYVIIVCAKIVLYQLKVQTYVESSVADPDLGPDPA